MAGCGSSVPPSISLTSPNCVVTSSRPAGVNASAVGLSTLATNVSVKPFGSAPTALGVAPARRTAAATAAMTARVVRVAFEIVSGWGRPQE